MEISKKALNQISKNNDAPKKGKSEKKKIKKDVAKVLNKGRYKNYLLSLNPYAMSVMDPWNVRGVRIPDLITTPSTAFSATQYNTLTVNANGVCGIIFGYGLTGVFPNFTPLGGLVPFNTGLAAPGTYCPGFTLSATATTAALLTGGPTDFQLVNFNSVTSSVPSLFTQVRLVSFGSRIVYTGSGLNAQGKITVASAPRQTYRDTSKISAGTLSLNDITQLRGCSIASVPVDGKAACIYLPQDTASCQYISTQTIYPNAQNTPINGLGGELYIIVDGAVATQTFLVESVWNFEAIPVLNTVDLVGTKPSLSDPIAESHAANIFSSADPTVVGDKASPKSSPIKQTSHADSGINLKEPDHPLQEKSIFENILDKIPGFVDKGVSMVEKLAPIAMAFL